MRKLRVALRNGLDVGERPAARRRVKVVVETSYPEAEPAPGSDSGMRRHARTAAARGRGDEQRGEVRL
jgi:hypothetical protein